MDAAISADGSVVLTSGLLTDSGLNVFSDITYVDRDVWLETALFGQKLNANASLVFQPLVDGVDVLDGTTGLLQNRVELPLQLPTVYDALAIDNADGLLFAIAPTGITQIDVSALPSRTSAARLKAVMLKGQPARHRNSGLAPRRPINWAQQRNDIERPRLQHQPPKAGPLRMKNERE